jgi:hypothetical protein
MPCACCIHVLAMSQKPRSRAAAAASPGWRPPHGASTPDLPAFQYRWRPTAAPSVLLQVHVGGTCPESRVQSLLELLRPAGGRLMVPVGSDLTLIIKCGQHSVPPCHALCMHLTCLLACRSWAPHGVHVMEAIACRPAKCTPYPHAFRHKVACLSAICTPCAVLVRHAEQLARVAA